MKLIIDSNVDADIEEIEAMITRAAQGALSYLKFDRETEISVLITDDKEIHRINKEFREVDRATDVLSFPLNSARDIADGVFETNPETNDVLLGDMVISLETCRRQGEEFGHGLNRELGYLTVHSVLHLFGYDHETEEEKSVMRAAEEEIMKQLGLER